MANRSLGMLLAGLCFAWLAAWSLGCRTQCHTAPADTDEASPWPNRAPGLAELPASMRSVMVFKQLKDVVDALDFGLARLPDDVPDPSAVRTFVDLSRNGPDTDDSGIAPQRPALLFERRGCPGATFGLDAPDRLRDRLETIGERPGTEVRSEGDDTRTTWRIETDGNATFRLVIDANTAATVGCFDGEPPPELAWFGGDDSDAPRPSEPEQSGRWATTPAVAELLDITTGDDERAIGIVDPGAWLKAIEASGQAAKLYNRVARQSGPVGFQFQWNESDRTIDTTVHHLADGGEPSVLSSLGSADGKLPPLGGLIEPGVLAVFRLSVDPETVYRLFRSALPAGQRRQLDAFWTQLEQRAMLEGPDTLLELWSGHAVVVAYGIEPDALSARGPELARRVFSLQATREAVLLPIDERAPLERTLDVVTQLSQGQLSRQTVDDGVQYLWRTDGVMEGALILGDRHLIIVDSATAFNRAGAYETRGRPLDDRTRQMGMATLLDDPEESGLFVDVGTLAGLLSENGHRRTAAWLMSFQSVALTTSKSGDRSVSKLEIKVDTP